MTHIFYITPKRPGAQEEKRSFGLFFQHKAGQGRAGGPVGKAAGQYRVPLQGQRVQPGEDRLLFGVPDHRAAVQHRGEDAAGAQRLEGRLQSRAYTKVDHGVSEVRTAYEVSVMKLEPVGE